MARAETVPAGKARIGGDRFDHVQGEVEAIGLLGIDGEADVEALGRLRQGHDARDQLVHNALPLGELIAGMERGELDRNAGAVDRTLPGGSLADGRDRLFIGLEIALGIGGGARGFAQHVVGIAIAAGLGGFGALQRLVDGAAHDELAAEDLHRLGDRLADHRLAAAGDQALQNPRRDRCRLRRASGCGRSASAPRSRR